MIMMMIMLMIMMIMMIMMMMMIIIIIIIIIIEGKHITAKMANHWPSTNTELMYNYFVFEGLFVNVYHHLSQMKLNFFTYVILLDHFSSGFYKNGQGVFKRYSPNLLFFNRVFFYISHLVRICLLKKTLSQSRP